MKQMMKILVSNILEAGSQRDFSLDEKAFKSLCQEEGASSALSYSVCSAKVHCALSRIGATVYLKGTVEADFIIDCSRCLAETPVSEQDEFSYTFMPEPAAFDAEAELSAAEIESIYYKDDIVDLGAVVYEQIDLLMTLRILCREDCQGLCPHCGADRNKTKCTCTGVEKSKFAALKNFKIKQ